LARKARRNLHVPLTDDLYARLHAEARRSGEAATQVAREAISTFLSQRERAAIDAEVEAFARRWAGTGVDLDPEIERLGVESLLALDDEER
jgi:predicted transcriptional regulator